MNKVAFKLTVYFYSIPMFHWIYLDDENKLTGKWRIIDDEVFVQVEHTEYQERLFFKPKIEKNLVWYPASDMKFIYESDCNDKQNML